MSERASEFFLLLPPFACDSALSFPSPCACVCVRANVQSPVQPSLKLCSYVRVRDRARGEEEARKEHKQGLAGKKNTSRGMNGTTAAAGEQPCLNEEICVDEMKNKKVL